MRWINAISPPGVTSSCSDPPYPEVTLLEVEDEASLAPPAASLLGSLSPSGRFKSDAFPASTLSLSLSLRFPSIDWRASSGEAKKGGLHTQKWNSGSLGTARGGRLVIGLVKSAAALLFESAPEASAIDNSSATDAMANEAQPILPATPP